MYIYIKKKKRKIKIEINPQADKKLSPNAWLWLWLWLCLALAVGPVNARKCHECDLLGELCVGVGGGRWEVVGLVGYHLNACE